MSEKHHEPLEHHYERLKKYVIHKVGEDRADDIVQQVFLKAHQSLSAFRHESELYTWLYTIAQNTIINEEKRSYRKRELLADREEMYRFVTSDFTRDVDFQIDLGTAMRHLDPMDQDIISMRFAVGLPFAEISSQLELNESTVKNRLYRCIGKMKNVLEDWYSPEPLSTKQLFIMVNMLERQKHMKQDDQVMDNIMKLLRKNFHRVTTMLNYVPTQKITYEVYPNIESFHKSLKRPVDICADSFTGVNRVSMVSPLNPGPTRCYEDVLRSALYLFGSKLAQQLNPQLPRWLYEGVGEYIGLERPRELVKRSLSARMRSDEIPTYNEIMTTFNGTFSNGVPRLHISYTLVDFIHTRYGLPLLQRLLREPEVESVFHKDLAELESEWRQFVCDNYLSHTITTAPATGSAEGVKELVILIPTSSAGSVRNRAQLFQKHAQLFEKANPGVIVTVETFDHWGQEMYLRRRLQRGEPVDLVFSNFYASLAQEGVYADLHPFYQGDRMTTDDLYKTLADMTTVNGKLTGIPMSPQPLVLFYNKEWFDQMGLAYPSGALTWQQYFEISKKLKAANRETGKAVYGSVTPFDMQFLETVALSNGHQVVSPDDNKLTGYIDAESVAEALKEVLGGINKGTGSKLVSNSVTPPFKELKSHNTGMAIGQAGMYFYLSKSRSDFGVAAIPKPAQGVQVTSSYISTLSMIASSNKQQLAWKFMKDVILDGNSPFHEDWGKLELLTSKAAVQKLELNQDPDMKVLYEQLDYANKPVLYRNPRIRKINPSDLLRKLASSKSKKSMQRELSEAALQFDAYMETLT